MLAQFEPLLKTQNVTCDLSLFVLTLYYRKYQIDQTYMLTMVSEHYERNCSVSGD